MEKMELLNAMVENLWQYKGSAQLMEFIETKEELDQVYAQGFDEVVTEKNHDNMSKEWYETTRIKVADFYWITLFHKSFRDE